MNMENVNRIIEWYRTNRPSGKTYVRVHQEPYMRLVIELQGDELWVGYWYEQNGDQVPDPVVIVNTQSHTGRVCNIFGPMSDDVYIHHFLGEVFGRLKRLDEFDKIEWN